MSAAHKIIKFFKNLICRFIDDDVMALGTQLAYNLLLSFFPFLIFLFSVLGFSSLNSGDVIAGFGSLIPQEAFHLVEKTFSEIFDTQNKEILSFSFVFTIFAASGGFGSVIKGLNKAYNVKETRNFFYLQFISVICAFFLVFIIAAAMVMLVFGHIIGGFFFQRLGILESFDFLWNYLRFAVVLLCMFCVFACLYYYAPCKKLKWKEVLPGAVFTTLVWVGSSIVFAFYINNFGNYSKVYGSLGAVIILLLWFLISSVVILIGGEINAALIEKCQQDIPDSSK